MTTEKEIAAMHFLQQNAAVIAQIVATVNQRLRRQNPTEVNIYFGIYDTRNKDNVRLYPVDGSYRASKWK